MAADVGLDAGVLVGHVGLGRLIPDHIHRDPLLLVFIGREDRPGLDDLVPGMDDLGHEDHRQRLGDRLNERALVGAAGRKGRGRSEKGGE